MYGSAPTPTPNNASPVRSNESSSIAPDSGFCVLRVKVPGAPALVTVIGSAASVAPGESLNEEGIWYNDRQHGLQFKANDLRQVPPSTAEGIERSIRSGMVKGIGPHFAKTWVRAFGDAVFEIIEPHPERLLELAGIFGALTNSFSVTGWEAVRPRQPRCTPHLRADGL